VEREEAERKRQEEAARREALRNRYNTEAQQTLGLVNAAKVYNTALHVNTRDGSYVLIPHAKEKWCVTGESDIAAGRQRYSAVSAERYCGCTAAILFASGE
jgi:hypothetical protein